MRCKGRTFLISIFAECVLFFKAAPFVTLEGFYRADLLLRLPQQRQRHHWVTLTQRAATRRSKESDNHLQAGKRCFASAALSCSPSRSAFHLISFFFLSFFIGTAAFFHSTFSADGLAWLGWRRRDERQRTVWESAALSLRNLSGCQLQSAKV